MLQIHCTVAVTIAAMILDFNNQKHCYADNLKKCLPYQGTELQDNNIRTYNYLSNLPRKSPSLEYAILSGVWRRTFIFGFFWNFEKSATVYWVILAT